MNNELTTASKRATTVMERKSVLKGKQTLEIKHLQR